MILWNRRQLSTIIKEIIRFVIIYQLIDEQRNISHGYYTEKINKMQRHVKFHREKLTKKEKKERKIDFQEKSI
jgi:hypothetical protein